MIAIWILLLSFLFLFTPSSYAEAQRETAISVAPAIIDIASIPGETSTRSVSIRNGSELSLPISVEVRSLLQDDELLDDEAITVADASKWVTIHGDKTSIYEPGESRKLTFDIAIPEDATPGGHYAQLSIRALSLESAAASSSAIIVPEIAVTLLITVAGEVHSSMFFEYGNIFPLFVSQNSEIMSSFTIVNDGNIHDIVSPVLIISRGNKEISRQQLPPKVILPQTKKQFSELVVMPDKYGVYKVNLEINYANANITTESKQETVVVSHSPILLFSLAVSTFIGVYLVRNRHNVKTATKVLLSKQPK